MDAGPLRAAGGKLAEAGRLLAGRFDAEHRLRISALGPRPASADEFLHGLRTALREMNDFHAAHGTTAVLIDQLEASLPPDTAAGPATGLLLREADELLADEMLPTFWEVPWSENLPALLHAFAEHRADGRQLSGAKLRTGGTEAAAFPPPAQLAAALVAAHDAGIALKFTAGLHHPFGRFDAGLATRMHGFVNVFAAGVLVCQGEVDAAEVQDVLEDEDPANFRFDADKFHWRDQCVTNAWTAVTWEFITSFGSCSFDEPRDDLRTLGLLP